MSLPAHHPLLSYSAAGANIVPADILETRVTPAALQGLVRSAKAAHMNMLRVWGGGRYFQGGAVVGEWAGRCGFACGFWRW